MAESLKQAKADIDKIWREFAELPFMQTTVRNTRCLGAEELLRIDRAELNSGNTGYRTSTHRAKINLMWYITDAYAEYRSHVLADGGVKPISMESVGSLLMRRQAYREAHIAVMWYLTGSRKDIDQCGAFMHEHKARIDALRRYAVADARL